MVDKQRKLPELLAPAGDMERLKMAVLYGADAVYLAGTDFGMRAFAGNFDPDELKAAVAYAHAHNVRVHCTINTMPRGDEIVRLPAHLERLNDAGVDAVIETELPKLKQVFHKPVMANISGFSVAEYAEVCEKLDAQKQVGWLEVNISCPNVHGGGAAFGADPKSAAEVTKAVRAVTKKPIILKLSPTAANIAAVAKACEDEGADGVSLINTMPGMRIDLKRRRPLLANTTGGMSGPGMFPLAVRMVYQVYEAVSIPIVGMGGVTTAEDVIELMLAGATAIGVGAANLVEPYACKTIIENLPAVMERYGMENLTEIIGGAHHG